MVPLRQELHVAILHLDGSAAQELLVELAALGQIGHVQMEMHLRAHAFLLQQQAVSSRTRAVTRSRCTE
jgi:hypothetical protein